MPVETSTRNLQQLFLTTIFGEDTEGFICISRRRRGERSWFDKFFYYPHDINDVLDYIEQNYRSNDIYVCTTLQSEQSRKATAAMTAQCVWADLDECAPSKASPPPSIALETSPGRWHGFWPLTRPIPARAASEYSRRMAYELSEEGADRSGWDVSQVLRVPGTFNFKYGDGVEVLANFMMDDVDLKTQHIHLYEPSIFDTLPEIARNQEILPWQDLPGQGDIPTYDFVYNKFFRKLGEFIQNRHMNGVDEDTDWSGAFFAEMADLFSVGATKEEALAFARQSKVNKFKRDGRDEGALWADILRIHHKVIVEDTLVDVQGVELPNLHPADPDLKNWIEDYVTFASNVTDAPRQYHEASAFIILSAILSSHITLKTSLGATKLNLWLLILGETTITRKSTAMNLAMSIINEVDDEVLLGTEEGSTEGLLDALRIRPHMSSVYHRDEVVGMLKGMARREHMAGALETYTKLYDGSTMKRNLRKEVITVHDPVFIFFGGGIKQSFYDVLKDEHMESGFLPRFLYVIGESKVTDLRPITRSTTSSDLARDKVVKGLEQIRARYIRQRMIPITDRQMAPEDVVFDADPTDEALDRFNDFNTTLMVFADASDLPAAMMPMMGRTAISTFKMAALLAAARQTPDAEVDSIKIEAQDMELAIYYIDKWMPYTIDVVSSAAVPGSEKVLRRILQYISASNGVNHSKVMRKFNLSSVEMRVYMDTLMERQLVQVFKKGSHGKGKVYHAA